MGGQTEAQDSVRTEGCFPMMAYELFQLFRVDWRLSMEAQPDLIFLTLD